MISDWSAPSTNCPTGVCLCVHVCESQADWGCSQCSCNLKDCLPGVQSDSCGFASLATDREGSSAVQRSPACTPNVHSCASCSSHINRCQNAHPRGRISPAADAAMQACSVTVPALQWRPIHIYLANHCKQVHTGQVACSNERSNTSPGCSTEVSHLHAPLHEVLLDDEWMTLEEAQVIVLDMPERHGN